MPDSRATIRCGRQLLVVLGLVIAVAVVREWNIRRHEDAIGIWPQPSQTPTS